MTHRDKGNYRKKHPENTALDPLLAQALEKRSTDRNVTCAAAHAVAAEMKVSPAEVGIALDLMEYRIVRCQMGLFGYHPERKIVKPAETVDPALETTMKRDADSGKLSCARSWAIARENGMKKMVVASAAEKLHLKIAPCQLGAF